MTPRFDGNDGGSGSDVAILDAHGNRRRRAAARATAVRVALLVIALGGVLACQAALGPASAAAAVCADFPNQAAAQRAHNTRDADHDGVYCESLPCPCPRPGGTHHPRRRPALFRGRCRRGLLADRRCTPGARLRASARQGCTPGWASAHRDVSSALKRRVYLSYGIGRHRSGEYEIDHLIPLELGGSNSPRNLWPERYAGGRGAHAKDRLEDRLHADVCAGRISLAVAQAKIARRWSRR